MLLIDKDESLEMAKRRQSKLEMKWALDAQLQMKKAAEEKQLREEREELRRRALEQDAHQDRYEPVGKSKFGEDMLEAQRIRAEKEEARRVEERKQNLTLLQHAEDIERKQIEAEEAKRKGGKEAACEYLKSLRDEAAIEEKENAHINRIRDEENYRLAALDEEKMKAEAEMKRRWMEEVRGP